MTRNLRNTVIIFIAVLFAVPMAQAQLIRRGDGSSSRRPSASREELNAKNIIDSAVEAFDAGQTERGVKALEQVARQYPNARARFKAWLLLGKHYMSQREFQKAIAEFRKVEASEETDEVSVAMTKTGICQYEMNAFDKAVSTLRRAVTAFPGATATNDAYYYIGLCHYHRKRWHKAMEAFEMVGTAIADRGESEELAEAGRRLFVRVTDKDLPVLAALGKELLVTVTASSGDEEKVALESIGRSKGDFVASVRTTTAASEPGDGVLRIRGGETVKVTYIDENTEAGEAAVKRLATVRLVSTGGLGITDGAFRQAVGAVAIEQPIYVRLKDLDLDTTTDVDQARIEVVVRYKVLKEEELEISGKGVLPRGVDLDETDEKYEWVVRCKSFLTLNETQPTSGVFTGRFTPIVTQEQEKKTNVLDELEGDIEKVEPEEVDLNVQLAQLTVRPGDFVEVRYTDTRHLGGDLPLEMKSDTMIVETGSPKLENMVSVSSDPDIQARKLLLEAQLRQMLASIFKEMGLLDRAAEKADSGLERVQGILEIHASVPLPRHLVEESFECKWNLNLAKNDVRQAIATCEALLELYPKSTLADQAFLKIGHAYFQSEDPDEVARAIPVLKTVADMEGAAGAAEASYTLGLVAERLAKLEKMEHTKREQLARSIAQFKLTAEKFPESEYAAEALQKMVNYYLTKRDYPRASELLERVCQDYQDQEWLHKMLLRWGQVLAVMKQPELAKEKLQQVVEEYPESTSAPIAVKALRDMQ